MKTNLTHVVLCVGLAALFAPASRAQLFGPTTPNRASAPVPAPEGMVWIPSGEFSMGGEAPNEGVCTPATSYNPGEDPPQRVHRGGSFLCTDQYCTRYMVGTRGKGDVDTASDHLGFRCIKGKPVGIQQYIGRRPIAAFGNSDGDLERLQLTAAGPGARFCLYVHHTDVGREFAYDRKSHIGTLDKGLEEAAAKGWTVVSMTDDWKTIFPPEKK